MKRGDRAIHKNFGPCLVTDSVTEGDSSLLIVAASHGGMIRFAIANETDMELYPPYPKALVDLGVLLSGMPTIPLPGEVK